MLWLLFGGYMHPHQAQAFVLASGARFVVANCRSHARLGRLLAPIVHSVHRFGCVAVYELAAMTGYGSHSRGRNDGIGSG